MISDEIVWHFIPVLSKGSCEVSFPAILNLCVVSLLPAMIGTIFHISWISKVVFVDDQHQESEEEACDATGQKGGGTGLFSDRVVTTDH